MSESVVEKRVSYRQCDFPQQATRRAATTDVHPLLVTQGHLLGIEAVQTDLQLLEVKHGLASSHFRYQQIVEGIPVFGAYLSLHEDGNGRVHTIHSTFQAQAQSSYARGGISPREAEQIAVQRLGIIQLRSFGVQSSPVWFPTENGNLIFAYQLSILSRTPLGNFNTVINAQNGELLFNENRIALDQGHGYVFYPNPVQTQGDDSGLSDSGDATSAALDAQRISVTLQGLNSGTGLLIGEFVDLATLNSPDLADVDADEPTRNYFYDRDDPRFEQVMIYHTVDAVQRYIHSLGFDDDTGMPNGIRDYQTQANAHWQSGDWSYFDPLPGDNAIHFGDGDVDDGEDGDIIVHEYGHAIQHAQNSNWGGGHMPSMGEGFGDYLAASFFADVGDATYQASDAACVAEWDAPPCLRRVDNNRRYPNGLGGSVHNEGQIWSRALWDIRGAVGREVADTVILEHHFALPLGSTMPDAALAVLQADADIYGSIHDAAIRAVFCDRGILSGATCAVVVDGHFVDLSPDAAKIADAGDVVTYSVQITNLGTVADSFDLSLGGNGWATTIDKSSVALPVDGTDTAVVTVTIPNNANPGNMDAVTVTAVSQGNSAQQDTAVLTTSVDGTLLYGVDLSPNSAQSGDVGESITYTMQITNEGTVADSFTLGLSGNSWPSMLVDTAVSLDAGATDWVTVTVAIPYNAAQDAEDVVTLTATSQGNPAAQDTVTATTTANIPEYGLSLSPDQNQAADAGEVVTYTIQLINVGENSDTFDIAVTGNSWATIPDATTETLAAGAQTTVDVVVTIPNDAMLFTDTAVVTFTSQGDNLVNKSIRLTTNRLRYIYLPTILKP